MRLCAVRGRLLIRSPQGATSTTTTMSFSPAGSCTLFIRYVLGWRAYSPARRGPSRADAHLYRIGGGCCEEAKFAFLRARIYSNLQRLGTPRFPEEKKRPASGALIPPFFPLFSFLQKERKLCILWPVTRPSTNNYCVTRGGRRFNRVYNWDFISENIVTL